MIEPSARPEPLLRKITAAETLEKSALETLLKKCTDAAAAQIALAAPHFSEHAGTALAHLRKDKRAANTTIADILDNAEAGSEFETAQAMALGQQIIEYGRAINSYLQAFNYYGGLSVEDYTTYVETVKNASRMLDDFLPVYIHLDAEQPTAAQAAKKALERTPEDFLRIREEVQSLLTMATRI